MAYRNPDPSQKGVKMEPIRITGLKQNNLKNISLKIPKNRIVVFTGVSGSGKSSIVFDTIAAESQRQMNGHTVHGSEADCRNMKNRMWR